MRTNFNLERQEKLKFFEKKFVHLRAMRSFYPEINLELLKYCKLIHNNNTI